MIVISGGAGLIGSSLVHAMQREELIIVDDFSHESQVEYLKTVSKKHILVPLDKAELFLQQNKENISHVFHMGANSSTEQSSLQDTIYRNIYWSQYYWSFCSKNNISLVYASSAATYGDGSSGFSDDLGVNQLREIKLHSLYSWSKMYFDLYTLTQAKSGNAPPKWYGLKFFNVYGVNEEHKGLQSSVVHPFLKQLQQDNKVRLFKSYNPSYEDGKQARDFISVNYCVDFIKSIQSQALENGIYNVGTGQAKTFLEFTKDIMRVAEIEGEIEFIEMPDSLIEHYQYFTESDNVKSQKVHDALSDFDYLDDLKKVITEIRNKF